MELAYAGLVNFLRSLQCAFRALYTEPVSLTASLFKSQVLTLKADTFWREHHNSDGKVL